MARNDERRIPTITSDKDGRPDLNSVQEAIRQLAENIYKIEGRVGESTLRDDLRVMGGVTLPARALGNEFSVPSVSPTKEGRIYFDGSQGKFKVSESARAYVDLLGSSLFTRTGTTITPGVTSDTVSAFLQDKGGEVFDVKAFGAKGDGVTDDTVAIQATATAAAAGGTVFFPPGTYIVSGTITFAVNAKVIVEGSGMDNTRIVTSHATADVFYIPSSITVVGAPLMRPTIVRQFCFDSSVARTGGSYINLDCSSAGLTTNLMPLVENCYFTGTFIGITIGNAQGAIVSRCLFTTFATGGVGIRQTTSAPFSADAGDNFISQVWMVDEFARASVGIQCVDAGAGLKICNSKTLGFATAVQVSSAAGKSSNLFHVSDSSFESWRSVGIDFIPAGNFAHVFLQDNDLATTTASSVGIRIAPQATGSCQIGIIAGNRIDSGSAATTRSIQFNGAVGCTLASFIVYGNIFSAVAVGLEASATVSGTCKAWGNFCVNATTGYSIASANFGLDFMNGYATRTDYGSLGGVISSWMTHHGGAGIPMMEMVTSAPDAASVNAGIVDFIYDTNSAGHKRIATISGSTEGGTANQRGGRLDFFTKPNAGTGDARRLYVTNAGSVVVGGGTAALGTTSTDGFLYVPTCNGAPSGVPTTQTGSVALIYDTSTNNFYIYNGAWKKVLLS